MALHAASGPEQGLPPQRRALHARLGLVVLLMILGGQALLPLFEPRGEVYDARSGAPIDGVVVRNGGAEDVTDAAGHFGLPLAPPWQFTGFEASGYERYATLTWLPGRQRIALTPLSGELRVVDDDSGRPLDATITSRRGRVEAVGPGLFRIAPIAAGERLVIEAQGYLPREALWPAAGRLEARLVPSRIGQVLDATTGQPIANALVLTDEQFVRSGPDGHFTLPAKPRQPLRVTAPGYRRLEVDSESAGSLDLRLEPFVVRGLYLTVFGLGDDGLRRNALRLLQATEANTLVVDVKGDRGLLAYPSRVPLAARIGADKNPTFTDIDGFLADLRARGYYSIARIVLFKDDMLARNGPAAGLDVAVKDRRTGRVWTDGEDLGWVDPFSQEVWEYNLALAREAALRGFDEVQFDYIRFPTDPSAANSVGNAVYSRESNPENRVAALAGFLERAQATLRPLGVFLSIDTFGYSCWRDDDMGVGQRLAALAAHVDYLSPMVYPSAYGAGLPGSVPYPAVIARPYDVVYRSLIEARARTAGSGALLRPWLQYFDDYAWQTGRGYNAAEIKAQKSAAIEAGAAGWLLWDPTNRYSRGGLDPR